MHAVDRDPCQGCSHLVIREGLAPWCARAAHYGQIGCVRRRVGAVVAPTRCDPAASLKVDALRLSTLRRGRRRGVA